MSSNYEFFSHFAQTGASSISWRSSSRSSPTRCGRRAKSSSMNWRACRCGRTDVSDRTEHGHTPPQIATTGHEWDGIRELNTPLPRWWLWLFDATIIWAVAATGTGTAGRSPRTRSGRCPGPR